MARHSAPASRRQFPRSNVPGLALAFALGAFLLAPQSLLATAQAPDVLIIDVDTFYINTNPLEAYFKLHPRKRPSSSVISTNKWRGYVATWEVKDDQLLLTDITVDYWSDSATEHQIAEQSALTTVFPGDEPIVARWFSGWLVVRTGEMVEYVHQGYASTFESYRLIRVREGRVLEQRRLDTEGFVAFRAEQFARFRKTPEYARAFEALKKRSPDDSDAEIEEFLAEIKSGTYTSIDFGD